MEDLPEPFSVGMAPDAQADKKPATQRKRNIFFMQQFAFGQPDSTNGQTRFPPGKP